MTDLKTFEGSSNNGNLQEALEDAIGQAQQSTTIADWLTEWTLKSVAGRRGGIAGLNQVAVTIEAPVPSKRS